MRKFTFGTLPTQLANLTIVSTLLFSYKVYSLDYALFGVDNCFLQQQTFTSSYSNTRNHLLRCPLPIQDITSEQKIRVRLYTLPHQLAKDCHIAGSTDIAPTYYRFSKFSRVNELKRQNEGLVYEAKLGGDGFFVSPSEGETWKLKYEIQCQVAAQPFLHSYSVIQTESKGAWVMY